MTREWHPRALARISLRSLQFVFACVSAALYAVDLGHWSSADRHANPSWIYSAAVSVLAVASCLGQWCFDLRPLASSLWDSLLVLLWLVAVAVFAQFLSGSDDAGLPFSKERIGAAVGIDVLNMVLWLLSAVEACICCGAARQEKRGNKKEAAKKDGDFVMENGNLLDDSPPAYEEGV